MYPHRIRLRGPWEAEPIDLPGPPRRVTLPARLDECGLGDCRRVRFRRRFGRPRQIDAHERIWLIGEGLPGRAELRVNGQPLGTVADGEPFALPLANLLGERNELVIDLDAADPLGGPWGDVALEVRCGAFLTQVRAIRDGESRLHLSGMVGGEADGPLELYALAGGRTIGYRTCVAGMAFEMTTDELTALPPEVRVELVNGAVIWYAVDVATK
jgi:hypothetical protein